MTVIALYLPYVGGGWQVLGFLPGYCAEEGFDNGSGIFLLQLLGHIVPLPDWVSMLYVALVLGALGVLAVRFAFMSPLPAAAGARVRRRRGRRSFWCSAAGGAVAALSMVFRLARAAGLPGAAARVLWILAAAPLLAHGPSSIWRCPALVYVPAVVLAAIDLCRRLRGAASSPTERMMSVGEGSAPLLRCRQSRLPQATAPPVCLYLEVTNRCNLLCETCPRTFEALEPPADMSWELFTSIVDQVPDVARVVLHGVGEPMLVRRCRA